MRRTFLSLINHDTYRVLQKSGYTFNFGSFLLKLNIYKNFIHFNNCHCITDTVYSYKKLLNVNYRLREGKRIEISTLLCAGYKKTKILMQLNVSRMTVHGVEYTFEGFRDSKGLPSTRKTSG